MQFQWILVQVHAFEVDFGEGSCICIQTYSAKESGSPRRYAIPWHPSHNSGQPAQASSLASLRILIPGRSILTPGRSVLKDFEAFWSRLSPAEVHFPLHFLDFFDFLEILWGGGGTPHFRKFLQKWNRWSQSENNLSINGVRKRVATTWTRFLLQDLLQYLAIAAFFDAFGRSSKNVGGGNKCV